MEEGGALGGDLVRSGRANCVTPIRLTQVGIYFVSSHRSGIRLQNFGDLVPPMYIIHWAFRGNFHPSEFHFKNKMFEEEKCLTLVRKKEENTTKH